MPNSYVNEEEIDTKSLNLQNLSNSCRIIPDKSFYILTTSILIPSTGNPLIFPHETPIATKSLNP